MPYVVKVGEKSVAVATLEEARTGAGLAVGQAGDRSSDWTVFYVAAAALPESGGTVGPLPDGTVIEVEPVELSWLAARAEGFLPVEIIADFNAKRASA